MRSATSPKKHFSPKHKRVPTREYNDINLKDMSADEFDQVVQENEPSRMDKFSFLLSRIPGLDTARTGFASLQENRKKMLMAAGVVVAVLFISIPIIATKSGNKSQDVENDQNALNSLALGGDSNPAAPDQNMATMEDVPEDAVSPIPTPSPSPSVTAFDPYPEDDYVCVSDRLANGVPLYPGTFLCSRDGKYVFGATKEGYFIYHDIESDEGEVFYEGTPGDYFVLEADGAFTVVGTDNRIKWQRLNKYFMSFDRNCLERYPCPYLHLHRDGTLALNFIDQMGMWKTKNFKHTLIDLKIEVVP